MKSWHPIFRYHRIFFGVLCVLFCEALSGCSNQKPHMGIQVVIETRFGDIEAELYPEKAPATVAAFLRNVDSGYYRNTSFYRILRDDNQVTGTLHSHLIQGGLWQTKPELAQQLPLIPHEPTNKTGLHHMAGALSMARNTPGTASSEFFICLKEEPGFDYGGENNPDGAGYAVFGKIISGMETVEKIYRQPEQEQQFNPPVTIVDIKRID
jgi:peptidyl-prolyl cis-trans isomerase A (cyclophilin A)